ncbi:MAG: N-acetylmuramoyl-L-alanine amidase [Pseudomonadota bacterium]
MPFMEEIARPPDGPLIGLRDVGTQSETVGRGGRQAGERPLVGEHGRKGGALRSMNSMPLKALFLRLKALSAASAAAGMCAAPGLAQPLPLAAADELRLTIVLPRFESPKAVPDWSARIAPDGRRVVIDFPLDRWVAPPILTRGEAALRAGRGPDGRARLSVATTGPSSLLSAAFRAAPDAARLDLVLRGEPGDAVSPPSSDRRADTRPPEAPLVFIDPGHGGVDPGAVVGGVREKDLVDAFAAELAAAIRASGRWRVAFSRDGDRFVRLDERWRRADAAGADVLLSIHANTVTRGDAMGAAVFTFNAVGGSVDARGLARRENVASVEERSAAPSAHPPERRVLASLARRVTLAESRAAGDDLAYALSLATPMLRGRAHEQADFRVLRSAHTPSALIELGFLTNAHDLARLQNPDWRARAAGALVAGLERWRVRAAGLSSDPASRYAGEAGEERLAAGRNDVE